MPPVIGQLVIKDKPAAEKGRIQKRVRARGRDIQIKPKHLGSGLALSAVKPAGHLTPNDQFNGAQH